MKLLWSIQCTHCDGLFVPGDFHSCPTVPRDQLDQVIAPVIKKLEKRLERKEKERDEETLSYPFAEACGHVEALRYALRLLKAGLRGLR